MRSHTSATEDGDVRLDRLIEGLDITPRPGSDLRVRITDVVEDSRTAVPGSLFIAKPGTHLDGARFIDDALRRGAEALLVDHKVTLDPTPDALPVLATPDPARTGAEIAERFFDHPSSKLYVAGVTGTNGKTTITTLAQSMLNHAGQRTGLIGTVTIDDGREEGAATLTTPPATELSRTLATMHEHDCAGAMLECSSHALDQSRCAAIRFNCAVFSNLSGDHLDYHGTLDRYAHAKSELFALLTDGLAIVNAHDPMSERMLQRCPHARVVRAQPAGAQGDADATVEILDHTLEGQRLRLLGPWGACDALLRTPGTHNATNALFAACIAHDAGLDAPSIADAIAHATMPAGRFERVETDANDAPVVLVDYAHTDDALRNSLSGVRQALAPGVRLVVVFGCGGDRDRTKRPRMGRAACQHADAVVLTSDNPRSEAPHAIINDVLEGLSAEERTRITVHADRAHAIRVAIGLARAEDVVVIAGKGHEKTQLLPDGAGGVVSRDFDDVRVARTALRERQDGALPA